MYNIGINHERFMSYYCPRRALLPTEDSRTSWVFFYRRLFMWRMVNTGKPEYFIQALQASEYDKHILVLTSDSGEPLEVYYNYQAPIVVKSQMGKSFLRYKRPHKIEKEDIKHCRVTPSEFSQSKNVDDLYVQHKGDPNRMVHKLSEACWGQACLFDKGVK